MPIKDADARRKYSRELMRKRRAVPVPSQPRSERNPTAVAREAKIASLQASGLTTSEIAAEVGLGERAVAQALEHVAIRREAEAQIDPETLPPSGKARLDVALRQHQRQLDADFERRVQAEYRLRLEPVLAEYQTKHALYQRVIEARKGVMDKATFNAIRRCLHPDSRNSVSDDRLGEAFDLFGKMEKLLLAEADSPTEFTDLPRTYAELMELRRRTTEARRAKRAAKTPARR